MRWLASALVVPVTLLMSCSPRQSDFDQLARMQLETTEARAQESVGCGARDWVCAEIAALRGQACAELGRQVLRFSPERRTALRECALQEARRLPRLLPAAPPPTPPPSAATADRIRQQAALAMFDGWRDALGAVSLGSEPTGFDGAIGDLRAIPGGEPYAATLEAARLIRQARAVPTGTACSILAREFATLPSAPPPMLQRRVDIERETANELSRQEGCRS